MPGPVERWLGTFMCKQYADTFDAYGFKTLQSVCQLQLPQLQAMGVSHDHCEKVLENVHILRQTLLGSMNHYSEQYGGYDAGGGRMSGMGYTGRYDEASLGGVVPNSSYPPVAHGYGDQNHMMMSQQHQPQTMSAHSGMYQQSQQYMMQQQQQQQQQHPNTASQYPSSYAMPGSDGHGQMGSSVFYGNAPQSQMAQAAPVHHHMRQGPTVSASPQQVADNILHIASAYPQQQTVQVPLNNKNRPTPYHIPRSPHYNMQTSPSAHQMGLNMARSPHYSMQSNSPNQSTLDASCHAAYPSSSPHQPPNRTSPVSPMLLHSPISQQSNHSHQSLPSPGSLHSPTSTGTVRSPVPSPGYHPAVGGLRSPSDMQQMAMSQQMRSMAAGHMTSPMGSSPHRSCSSGTSSQQQQQQHYSMMGSPQSQQEVYHSVSSGGDLHSRSQSQLYHNPSTSASVYVSETGPVSGQSSSSRLTNPLQSLQKLVMLPESRVVDPKSVVNDACLPSPQSQEGSKNCDSSADRLGEDYSRSAECQDTADRGACTDGKSPRCLDGKNCSDGEQEENCNSKTSGSKNVCHKTADSSRDQESNSPKNAENSDSVKKVDNILCKSSEASLEKKGNISNNSVGNNETKVVNGDISMENMDNSLRNSARKHPKTRIKKLSKNMSDSKSEADESAASTADASGTCSPDVSKQDTSDSAFQTHISNGPLPDTYQCEQNENTNTVEQNTEKNCDSVTNSKDCNEESNEKQVNKTNAKPLSSESGSNESEHSGQKDAKDSPHSGWGLFLKSNEDFNDFEHELSDNEDENIPVRKPFSSSPVRSDMSAAHKLDFCKIKTENISGNKSEKKEKGSESKEVKTLNRSKRLRSNETIEVSAKKIKLSENLDAVQSLPPKKSPKGRIRKSSATDSVESTEKEIVKEPFDLEHCKLNKCFVDLSSDLTTKLVAVQEFDLKNIKNIRPRRKSLLNSSDDDLKEKGQNPFNCNHSSKKKHTEQDKVVDAICKKEPEAEQSINGRKIRTRRKSSNIADLNADVITVDSSEDGSVTNQGGDSDENDSRNENHILNSDMLTPKREPEHNTKTNVARRKLSPLRFVNSTNVLKDNTKENDPKGKCHTNCNSDSESAEKLGGNLDCVKAIKVEDDESNDSDKEFLNGLEVKFENCESKSPATCNKTKPGKCESSKNKQSMYSKNSSKKNHKSKSKTRRGKQDKKKSFPSFDSLNLTKRTEFSNQKKKKINSIGPFVRIEGTKQFPNAVKLFNQTPVDDGDSKSSKNHKTGFVSAPTIQVSNIPSDKSVMLPLNRILSEESWLCALCGKQTSHKSLGDLFGPYYLESHLPLVKAEDSSKKDLQTQSGISESKTEPPRNARRRRSSAVQEVNPPPAPKPVEVWVHEDCVLWADGVFLIGSKIYGLEEAVRVASSTACSSCRENGAMVGCLYKGCSQKYHFVCAVEKACLLDEERFSLLCPKHKALQEKKLKSVASASKS